eukprot:6471896-Amphidinium_carterae.1
MEGERPITGCLPCHGLQYRHDKSEARRFVATCAKSICMACNIGVTNIQLPQLHGAPRDSAHFWRGRASCGNA